MLKPKIGLTFSGGGFRAATFDLGVLSFLNAVPMDEGGTLLDCVAAMSSVSGGTIPAMRYMLARAQGQPVDEMITEVFDFLCENDLVSQALERVSKEKANPKVSLIKIMAEIYDEYLFGHQDLGVLMDNIDRIPVKDYTALATDFDSALPFRFRVAGYLTNRWGNDQSFYDFGNYSHRISLDDARHITMGEVMACSSCFPGGFEPMMFPEDFKLSQHKEIAEKYMAEVVGEDGEKELRGFGIMDGGVADNEGIESILMSESRMRIHRAEADSTDKALDLIIVSDVSNPDMEGYAPSGQLMPLWAGKLTIGRLRNYGLMTGAVLLGCLALALFNGNGFWTGVTTVLLAIVAALNFGGAWLKKTMNDKIADTFIGDRARFISHMKFASAGSMLMNRAMSLFKMSSEVFLRRQRQLYYSQIQNDPEWNNRKISNRVYELRAGEPRVNPAFKPSAAMQAISAKATDVGTTLWFTQEDKANGIPQALLAAGQFTICYNLLDYIDKIQKDPVNLSEAHDTIIALKPRLMQAWEKFQQDPQWMVPKK